MKKIRIIGIVAVLLLMVLCFTGCGNMSLGLGNYEFNYIHVDNYHYSGCIEIEKWYENGTGIEVQTKDYGNVFFSEGCYTLIEDECPLCKDGVINEK